MKEGLILIGAGGHCRSCIEVLELQEKYSIEAIVDRKENIGKKILNYEITHCDEDLESLISKFENCLICIGQIKSNDKRVKFFNRVKACGGKLPVIVSPLSHVSQHAHIEEGTIVFSNAFINAGCKIGKNCIINNMALVEHDVVVSDHCHLAPACVVNGGTFIGENSFIGSNAVVREALELEKNSIIGAGTKKMRGDL